MSKLLLFVQSIMTSSYSLNCRFNNIRKTNIMLYLLAEQSIRSLLIAFLKLRIYPIKVIDIESNLILYPIIMIFSIKKSCYYLFILVFGSIYRYGKVTSDSIRVNLWSRVDPYL